MEIVTGKAGTPHVSSADDGRRIAGEVGADSYVLQTGGRLAPSLVDANTVRFATGDMVVQGRHIGLTAPEDVKVASGTQGKKRTDYICVHYKRDVSGANPTLVEKVEWKVLQGTPGATATAPSLIRRSILNGDADVTVPVCSVSFDGLTTGAPKLIIPTLTPLATLGDSVSQQSARVRKINFTKVIGDPNFHIRGVVVDNVATIWVSWVNVGEFVAEPWGSTKLATMDVSCPHEGFAVMVDSDDVANQGGRLLHVAGNCVSFRTKHGATIPANMWHRGSLSFPIS